jgi:deoxyribodipyrimidine photolyase-related protein
MASKPYAASGAYIDRMSDFCKTCRYDVKAKNGAEACPFNYLYWNFVLENEEHLQRNPRVQPVLRTLKRMTPEKVEAVRRDSQRFFEQLYGDGSRHAA